MTPAIVLGALLVGAAYGYIAQRGAFCLNSGFRFVISRGDTTKLKAYGLAVAIQMLVLPLVFASGLSAPNAPAPVPLGAVVGGVLFGLSMGWAGGCAAGIWYKLGAGSMGALAAIVGLAQVLAATGGL